MRLTELVGKEIVNIFNGARLGVVADSDITFDAESGHVHAIIFPRRSNFLRLWMEQPLMEIPWSAVRKVGTEVIVVEVNQNAPRSSRFAL